LGNEPEKTFNDCFELILSSKVVSVISLALSPRAETIITGVGYSLLNVKFSFNIFI
jgi:hypothetical protein